jgi:hypothetical protein
MPVIWKPPSIPGAAQFAEWEGAIFGLVREIADGLWRVGVLPDGKSWHSIDARVASEALAKKFIERWARYNHARIAPQKGRQVMPHEGLKPRKPKDAEDRS